MSNKCIYLKDNEKQCDAYAQKDSEYCFSHDPEKVEARIERAAKGGGMDSYRKLNLKIEPLEVNSAHDIASGAVQLANELREGKIPVKIATAVGYLLSIALKAYEKSDLEQRIESFERIILERGKRS